jgi:flagellar biosynthesis protein FliR
VTATVVTAGLVFARLNGLLFTLPVFSTVGLPRYLAPLLALVLTLLLAPGVPLVEGEVSTGLIVLGLGGELLLGAGLGLVVRAVFAASAIAAELLSQQTALGMATLFDPVLSFGQSPLGVLASWLAGLVFLAGHQHHQVLVLLADSFAVVPPGGVVRLGPVATALVEAVGTTFVLGVELAGPLIALVFLVNVFIGILGKLAPRMNVFFSVGMTVNSVVGIWLFGVALPWMLERHRSALEDVIRQLAGLVAAVG